MTEKSDGAAGTRSGTSFRLPLTLSPRWSAGNILDWTLRRHLETHQSPAGYHLTSHMNSDVHSRITLIVDVNTRKQGELSYTVTHTADACLPIPCRTEMRGIVDHVGLVGTRSVSTRATRNAGTTDHSGEHTGLDRLLTVH